MQPQAMKARLGRAIGGQLSVLTARLLYFIFLILTQSAQLKPRIGHGVFPCAGARAWRA